MSEHNWTSEQLQAIEQKNKNILVAAAAGSGKTTVLVERIIRKIINDNINIDEILVVTFTNAAASEMKEKIINAIYKKIEEEPQNEHLKKQINLLNKAKICTIHSFCLDVIKNNFFEIEITPNFRIGDTTEIELLKLETIEDLFEEKYDNKDKDFIELVETYTGYKGDEPLKEIVKKVYEFIQSCPFPKDWLERKVEEFNFIEAEDFGNTSWGKLLLEKYKEKIDEKIDEMMEMLSKLEQNYELERWINTIRIDIQNLKKLREDFISWEKMIHSVSNFKFERWPSDKKVISEIKDYVQKIRSKKLDDFRKIKKEMLAYNSDEIIKDLKDTYEILNRLKNLIFEFSNKYENKKKEKNIVDFNDIEHYALKILVKKDENGKNAPTEIAKQYKNKFNEIAIDEYQDSNLVQEYILTTVSKGDNIFMVGDVKQSIYKFRQARPELFLEKYNTYSDIKNDSREKNIRIKLFKNFRSRKNILNTTNIIFKEIMSKELGDIDYDEEEFLNLGAKYPESSQNLKTELHLIDLKDEIRDEWKIYEDNNEDDYERAEPIEKNLIEAKLICKRIKKIINDGFQVCDKNNVYRNATYKDIVILLRTTKNIAAIYERELLEQNIPVYCDSSTEFLDTIEIQTIMNVLKIIDNPLQDIPMVAVLRSIIGDFTDDELVEIRLADKYCSFYEALEKAKIQVNRKLANKIENFISKLNKWREEQEYISLDELIWKIYEETDYYNYVELMPNGQIRQANLKILFEKAKMYENTNFSGLFNFINFMEKIKTSSKDLSSAKIIGENENVVRIISIHKSKGLEFPIVFLSNTSKQFNMMDLSDKIILDQDIGIGPKLIDYNKKIEFDTKAKEAIKYKAKKDIISEEMRILYVALTRAKEKLIIIGSSKDLEKELDEKKYLCNSENKKIQNFKLIKNANYLSWIEQVYLKNKDKMSDYFEIYKYTKKDLINNNDKNENNINKMMKEKFKNIKKQIDSKYLTKLNWKYQNNELTKIKSKMSVTEIKKIKTELNEEESFNEPKFLSNKEKIITGAKIGTITHMCLQRLDINVNYDMKKINELLNELVMQKLITKEENEKINRNRILNFTKSEIWKQLKSAKEIEKEKPFYINIPVKKIYRRRY